MPPDNDAALLSHDITTKLCAHKVEAKIKVVTEPYGMTGKFDATTAEICVDTPLPDTLMGFLALLEISYRRHQQPHEQYFIRVVGKPYPVPIRPSMGF